MKYSKPTRRDFISQSAAGVAAVRLLGSTPLQAQNARDPIRVGFVGAGIRFHSVLGKGFTDHGPCLAICDVDANQREPALAVAMEQHQRFGYAEQPALTESYREVLDNPNINLVVIATPDHWHTKVMIEALQAGKDVYCEKPMSLTIREGQQTLKALRATNRIVQIGTQQRTEFGQMFAKAAAMVRDGRIGRVQRVTCAIGGAPRSPALPVTSVPKPLNWELWQGQAPEAEYRLGDVIHTEGWGAGFPLSRTHRYFRWWYEYSGGKVTDWGAHHIDIALWALGKLDAPFGKIELDPIDVSHPMPLKDGMPTQPDRFNAADAFRVHVRFEDDLQLVVRNTAEDLGFGNGILFEGAKGRFFVNRGKLTGKPVEELVDRPLPEDWDQRLYGRPLPPSHIDDFLECIATRAQPISDVATHHRMMCCCHAINICMRLNRKMTFDSATERFIGDGQANEFLQRDQRAGYEIVV